MMTAAPLTPRARARRERIHQAAQTLFMQQGFEATSMEAIAEAAAVSKPTLYRYYQSKEALFIAVLEHLALHQLSEDTLLVLRDRPMDSLATLEQALAGSLLTYVLGNGLLATAPPLQIPPPEQIDALVRLALQGMASPQAKEAH
jgi:AcrR family transcriptional regulator